MKHNLGPLVLVTTHTNVEELINSRPNIIFHMGASTWTAKVRAVDDNFVTFSLREMERREQHSFRREPVKAFREAGLLRQERTA
jgi:hypothetical protein